MVRPGSESSWTRALEALGAVLRAPRREPCRCTAGVVELGPARWAVEPVTTAFTPVLVPGTAGPRSVRGLVGWMPLEGVGVYLQRHSGSGAQVAIVLRDGTELADPGLEALVPLLRRAVCRPSGVMARRPWPVAVDRMARGLLGAPEGSLGDALVQGRLRSLPEVRDALGPCQALLSDDLGWEELRQRSGLPLARWCDAEMFGWLTAVGVPAAEESLAELEQRHGAYLATLARDQLLGPW